MSRAVKLERQKDAVENRFRVEDKVLVTYGGLIYDATIEKVAFRSNAWRYLVHYTGWSDSWDEWVGIQRVLPITEKNLQKQDELFRRQNATRKAVPSTSHSHKHNEQRKPPAGFLSGNREKQSLEHGAVLAVQPALPRALRKQLISNWEFVTQQPKSIKLPRNPNVDEILNKYLEQKTNSKENETERKSVLEISNGLRFFFNRSLRSMLLYRQEQKKHDEMFSLNNTLVPSIVYGAEHFLRLFVKLPELLAYENMDEESSDQLEQKLLDLLKFIEQNQGIFFPDYSDEHFHLKSMGSL